MAELQCGESWEDISLEFHWLTINSVQSSVFLWTFEPRQSVFPCHIWLWVLVHLSKADHRIWKYVNLRVRETDDLFIANQRQILPWRVFPVNCFHSIDLIWLFWYQFLWYVEQLFHCEIFCIFDRMSIVWVIRHHEYRCSQCWRHKHSPYYRMFVTVFCCIFWRLFLPLSHLISHPAQEWSGS